MRKNLFILISILAVFLFVFAIGFNFFKELRIFQATIALDFTDYGSDFSAGKEISVAACPTFYYMLDKIEGRKGIKTIKTQSTSESLNLLEQLGADLVISGRALKPDEMKFLSQKIGQGYDFIFAQEFFALEQEMQLIPFYSDLSLDKIIKDFDFISEQNLAKTENIDQDLNKGVIITFLENEMKGEMVHIFQENGERLRLSRLPRLYYSLDLEEEKIKFIKEIIKEN